MNDAHSGGNSDVVHFGANCAATGLPGALGCSLRDAVIFANSQVAADTCPLRLAGTIAVRSG